MIIAYPVAILFAWRLAWHIALYNIMAYGGSLASEEEMARARRRYAIGFVLCGIVLLGIVTAFLVL
jgi:hypothetical protein